MRSELPLDDDVGVGEAPLDVALANLEVEEGVPGNVLFALRPLLVQLLLPLLVDERRARRHGLHRVKDRRKFLDADTDGARGRARGGRRLGDHDRDGVSGNGLHPLRC